MDVNEYASAVEKRWMRLESHMQAKIETISGFDRTREVILLRQAVSSRTKEKAVFWLRNAAGAIVSNFSQV